VRLFDVAEQPGRVARPAGPDSMRHWEAGYACRLGHDLPNAIAGAASNIELLVQTGDRCTLQSVQRTEMRIGQIADMDEIADAGPIRRRIVVAWQCKRRTEPQRRIDGQWPNASPRRRRGRAWLRHGPLNQRRD
jgi:hypothetical protein